MSFEKLRVLHLSTWNVPCGIASYCANLVKGLNAHGVESDVYPLRPYEWQTYLPRDVDQLMADIRKKARDFDVVHLQHEHAFFGYSRGSSYAVKRYAQLLKGLQQEKRPVVTTFHTEITPGATRVPKFIQKVKDWLRLSKWRNHVAPYFGSQPGMSRAIVHSTQTRYVFAKGGFDPNSIHVVPHACMPSREHVLDRETAKERLGIQPRACLVTIFGFIGKYKGHDIALEALKWLPEKYHLAIVGGAHPESRDDFLHQLLSKVNKKLRSRVTITGYVENETANLYYAATDICLAPYRPQSHLSASGAITWALSSGRPIIASKIDAFQAIHREADCLMMVTPEVVRELAWSVEKLYGDEALQQKLVANSQRYVAEHSWHKAARETIEIYNQMLGRSTAEPSLSLQRAA